jgi:hypothetical protein
VEEALVSPIEWAVDEDVAVVDRHQLLRRSPTTAMTASRICFDVKCFGMTVLRKIFTPSRVSPTT